MSGGADGEPFFTAAELAAYELPGLPATRPGVQAVAERRNWRNPRTEGRNWRRRKGRGGGIEYSARLLPIEAQAALWALVPTTAAETMPEDAGADAARASLWQAWDRASETKRKKARLKWRALRAVSEMLEGDTTLVVAREVVGKTFGIAPSGLARWENEVAPLPRADWLPALLPSHQGRTAEAECSEAAWRMFLGNYLRPEKPSLSACYRRLERVAKQEGWTVPSRVTLQRRVDALDPQMVVAARDGAEALKRLYPAQERDRSQFHALEAVNADGHLWDVFVRWPDGTLGRPHMISFQDLHSDMILSWRLARSESRDAVRLAIGDLVETYGIPSECYFDNGRAFAAKWITGGTPNRFRFKVRDEDPLGLLPELGVAVHFTLPYSGQSKPIERAFRDFATDLAKHPAFAGAYTGNDPLAKPENYGAKAVPLDVFARVVAEGIAEHNARTGRRTRVCGGRLSFREAFEASYAVSAVRKAAPEQRRLWLLAAESVRVKSRDGAVELLGNRYWSDVLLPYRGQHVVARFDPEALHRPLHLYRVDGVYLGAAEMIAATGFADAEAAREHGRERRKWMRAARERLEALGRLSPQQIADMLPAVEPPEPPEPKIVRLVHGNTARLAVEAPGELPGELPEQEGDEASFVRGLRLIRGTRDAPGGALARDDDEETPDAP